MNKTSKRLSLFSAYGVELEYMIVDVETLSVKPIADRLIHSVCGAYESEIERGAISWSNELVTHVIELKTNGPADSLIGLADRFQAEAFDINERLAGMGARLMPTAMHPWMNPDKETRLWPHEYSPIYEAYNRIFGCRGHGWSNLQSVHLNLPFASDEEFGRLHAAIRILMPLLPALAASSPIEEWKPAKWIDARMEHYRANSLRVPSVSGHVIPEAAFTQADYETKILKPMYRDIAPFDPDNILQEEWLNARGAIARFDRGSIEIRVLDIQECPAADLAILLFIDCVLKTLISEKWSSYERQQTIDERELEAILTQTIQYGEDARIENSSFLQLVGVPYSMDCTAKAVWEHLYQDSLATLEKLDSTSLAMIESILHHGCLSRRIMKRLGGSPKKAAVRSVYKELCDCLVEGRMFLA